MASIYDFDGFEDYATAGIAREHTRVQVSANVAVVSGGRNGGNRLRCHSTSSGVTSDAGRVVRPVPSGLATLCFGAYMEISALDYRMYCLDFRDGTVSHVLIAVNTDGSVVALRSFGTGDFGHSGAAAGASATTLGTSAAGVISVGVPFHLQAKVTVDDSTGAVEIKINNVSVLTVSSADTRNGGTAGVTSLLYGASAPWAGTRTVYYDDVFLASDFVGDRRVDSHIVTSDGTNLDGTPSAGADHYAMVDEAAPDDDTTYVTLDAAGERESYGCEDFKNTGADIDAALVVVDVKKADAGTATVATHVRQSSTDYDGTAQGLTTSYSRVRQVYATDPATATAWTEAGFNAAEFGYKKVA